MGDEKQEALTTFFKIVVPGLKEMVFSSCEGLESEIDVEYIADGGSLGPPKTARGAPKTAKISFGHGTLKGSSGKSLFEWYQEVWDSSKALEKKALSISVLDADGKEVAEWRVAGAWPCRWVAPLMSKDLSGLAVEYVTFAHEGIERKK